MRAHNSAGWSDPSARFSFRVELPAQKPQVPRVVSPGTTSEGSVVQGLTPTFKWEAVPGAERYGLYISKHPFGETNVVYRNETIKATTFSLPKGVLAPGEKYRWNVRALGKAGWGSASNKLYFATRGWAVAAAIAPKEPDETIVTKALPDDKSADERATEKAVSEPTKAPPVVAPVEKLQISNEKPAASQTLAATDNGRERKKEESKDGLSSGKENSRKASPFVVASSSLPSGVIVEGEIPRWRARDLAEDQDDFPAATREKPATQAGPVSPPIIRPRRPHRECSPRRPSSRLTAPRTGTSRRAALPAENACANAFPSSHQRHRHLFSRAHRSSPERRSNLQQRQCLGRLR